MKRKYAMKKTIIFFMICGLTISGCHSSKSSNRYTFIKKLQNINDTGLVASSKKEDNFTTVYKNALAAMAFVHEGDLDLAERIFDVFLSWYQDQDNFQGFHQHWYPKTGTPNENSSLWEGDNAFLLMALAFYQENQEALGKYDVLIQGLKDWLLQRTDLCDSIVAEGNANMYAALKPFGDETADGLVKLKDCFYADYHPEWVVDHTVRASLVFDDVDGFENINTFVMTEAWQHKEDIEVKALAAHIWEPKIINVEISWQYALAADIKEQSLSFDLAGELEKVRINGGYPYHITDHHYTGQSKDPMIDTTCYSLFYDWGFNPWNTPSVM